MRTRTQAVEPQLLPLRALHHGGEALAIWARREPQKGGWLHGQQHRRTAARPAHQTSNFGVDAGQIHECAIACKIELCAAPR